jgi:hypothetical protein
LNPNHRFYDGLTAVHIGVNHANEDGLPFGQDSFFWWFNGWSLMIRGSKKSSQENDTNQFSLLGNDGRNPAVRLLGPGKPTILSPLRLILVVFLDKRMIVRRGRTGQRHANVSGLLHHTGMVIPLDYDKNHASGS